MWDYRSQAQGFQKVGVVGYGPGDRAEKLAKGLGAWSEGEEEPGWAAMPAFTCPVPQDPVLLSLSPQWGPQAGGTQFTIHGQHLQTGGNISAFVGSQSCPM